MDNQRTREPLHVANYSIATLLHYKSKLAFKKTALIALEGKEGRQEAE